MTERNITSCAKALAAALFTLSMVFHPEEAFRGALEGLIVWWEVVFPALLPFFAAAEILMGLGVVHFMGALLEPLMRPLFKVPGVGAFALSMGFASGYPIGAKITGRLRREGLCTRIEGERLVSFTNTADPLFMVGAVAVGMLGRPDLGLTLAGAHYLSCLVLGLLLRFHGRGQERPVPGERIPIRGLFGTAMRKLYEARARDGRDLGQLMGDAVMEAVNTLLLIGGFIIIFSVMSRMLDAIGIANLLRGFLGLGLALFNISEELLPSLINGLLEISNGTQTAARATAPLGQKLAVSSFIIAWSGLSVHAQVASMVNHTDIRMLPYVGARVIHAFLAGLFTVLLLRWSPGLMREVTIPVFAVPGVPVVSLNFWSLALYLLSGALALLLVLLAISLLIHLLRSVRVIVFYR